MKNVLIVLVLLAGAFLTGCGLTDSLEERERRYSQITDLQLRMLVDDWDYVWLMDQNSNLTEFHPRVGF